MVQTESCDLICLYLYHYTLIMTTYSVSIHQFRVEILVDILMEHNFDGNVEKTVRYFDLRPALAGGSLPSFLGNGLVVKNRQ